MIDYPNKLEIIFDKLDKLNIKPIIVGGYNRDKLLNLDSKDIDIELYGIDSLQELETILEEFGDVNSVGKSFGICKLKVDELDIDFSLPRTDSKISDGHKGFSVQTNSSLDFKTASSRRDFTINAIGYDVKSKKILDPFNGRVDIQKKLLKAVDVTKFAEDPLRVLRAVSFASRFSFSLDGKLFSKCKEMIHSGVLDELPRERIYQEIKKLLLKSPKPSVGIILLKKIDGFLHFNELNTLSKVELTDTLSALDYFASLHIQNQDTKTLLMLTILISKLNKANAYSFLDSLVGKKELIAQAMALYDNKDSLDLDNAKDYELYALATKVNLENYFYLLNAITLGQKVQSMERLTLRAKNLGVLHKGVAALIQGRDLIKLGFTPSQEFSKLLKNAYEAQMRSKFNTHEEAIIWLKRELA